jgi:hypothetical protein
MLIPPFRFASRSLFASCSRIAFAVLVPHVLLGCSSGAESEPRSSAAFADTLTSDADGGDGGGAPLRAAVGHASDTIVVQWNDNTLQAIRETHPGPPIVARSLAVVSTAMFEAWAMYDAAAVGTRLGGSLRRPSSERTDANRAVAISYAAYAALVDLFPSERPLFDAQMAALALDPRVASTDVTSAVGVGQTCAKTVISFRHQDGSNQLGDLTATTSAPYADYTGYAPVNTPDVVNDMYHWQPLRVSDGHGGTVVQRFITPHWFKVIPFALSSSDQFRPGVNALPAKNWGHYKKLADEVLSYSAALTDEQKVIAEYWADGPASELPPGHWALFAAFVSRRDHHTIGDDAKMFFAMTNAVLDASVSSWDAKRAFDFVRPITVVHVVHGGDIVSAWAGPYLGTASIAAESWRPYQAITVVTPPFPEFFSGHSVFSAAAAEVLKSFTGSDAFGGSFTNPKGVSRVEPGTTPAADVTLSWATFSDAADQAGMSRRYGGIHFSEGDLAGRAIGRQVGAQAWAKAQTYFAGASASCATAGAYCCSSGVACIGSKCDRRCSECDACAGRYCCAPNGMGHPVTCSTTPTCA